jgi:hypothetical protein
MSTVGKVLIFVYSTAVCLFSPWPLNIVLILLLLCGTNPLAGEDGDPETDLGHGVRELGCRSGSNGTVE